MVWGNDPDGGLTGRGVCTHVHTLVLPLAQGMVPQVARDSEAAAILLCRFRVPLPLLFPNAFRGGRGSQYECIALKVPYSTITAT